MKQLAFFEKCSFGAGRIGEFKQWLGRNQHPQRFFDVSVRATNLAQAKASLAVQTAHGEYARALLANRDIYCLVAQAKRPCQI